MATIISTKTSGVGGLQVTGDASGVLQLASNNGTTAVTVDASQNVGIGTASPTTKLSITTSASEISNFNSTNASGSFASISNAGTNYGFIGDASQLIGGAPLSSLGIRSQNNLIFSSGGFAERMRIDSSGNVGIGTSSATTKLDLVAGNQVAFRVYNTNTNDSIAIWQNQGGSVASTTYVIPMRFGDSTYRGGITWSGSAVAYNTTSDYRLKENVQPIQNALSKIELLNPVTFTWKETGKDGEGFIAHELQEYFPEAVTGTKDAVDEEGNIFPQSVDTSFLVATLTAAIQELKAIIDTQAERIAVLENK